MSSLRDLETRIARDLSLTDYPARSWVPARRYRDEPVLDVLIVGNALNERSQFFRFHFSS